ncbi:MAG: tetraacyldisaccharide 4'-kinase [Holosporales bacterium]|jgi:tetraacyldisaccharide 4'-kinase|nr:tetraacyldisaccharide 4'-kinase [Holosporales bacterium]
MLKLKTPAFWRKKSFLSVLLCPLSIAYRFARRCSELFSKPTAPEVPSITVGGITVGGSGKTPVAFSLYNMTKSIGRNPFIISRGYGGRLSKAYVQKEHCFKDVGDEPLMLTGMGCNVFIGKNKLKAAVEAQRLGADTLIFDDGLQTTSLKSNINFLVIDGNQGIGNAKLFPAGPLREPLSSALQRVDAVIFLGGNKHDIKIPGKILVFYAETSVKAPTLRTKKAIAFCGLGFPDKFFSALVSAGVSLAATRTFPDHYCYKEKDINALIEMSIKLKAQLITTRKDLIKIPFYLRRLLSVADLDITWKSPDTVINFIKDRFIKT